MQRPTPTSVARRGPAGVLLPEEQVWAADDTL